MGTAASAPDQLAAGAFRLAIAAARYNEPIVTALLEGARAAWKALGGAEDALQVEFVPGAFELPLAARALALQRGVDGVVALGCVIRGDTIHFEIVSQLSAQGLLDLSVARALPLGNGIVTVNTLTQALARARLEDQDKGGDAARAALSLIGLKKRLGAR